MKADAKQKLLAEWISLVKEFQPYLPALREVQQNSKHQYLKENSILRRLVCIFEIAVEDIFKTGRYSVQETSLAMQSAHMIWVELDFMRSFSSKDPFANLQGLDILEKIADEDKYYDVCVNVI